jgi:hypothetical protein
MIPVPKAGEIWCDRARHSTSRSVTVIGCANGEVQFTAPAAFAQSMLQRHTMPVELFVERYRLVDTPKDAA